MYTTSAPAPPRSTFADRELQSSNGYIMIAIWLATARSRQ